MKGWLWLWPVLMSLSSATVSAEPIGKWWSGSGQGIVEYGIKNDSGNSDVFYVACAPSGATINVIVGGVDPRPGSTVIVTIGGDEFELHSNRNGEFDTISHVNYDIFRTLWEFLRKGRVMRVRLATGQSTVFTLSGASKVLPQQHCETAFEM